jgi:hypothetical protein
MRIYGTPSRILDSALPHEVMHTILATHFKRPVPRWVDEGIALNAERNANEHEKHQKILIEALTSRQGLPFSRMLAMREYPRNVWPLYAQGYSVTRYLVLKGGKQKLIDFINTGLHSTWTEAANRHYESENLLVFQNDWNDWVRQGSPGRRIAAMPSPQWGSPVGSVCPPGYSSRVTVAPRTSRPPVVSPQPTCTVKIDYQKIVDALKNDPGFMAACKGDSGPPGKDGLDGTPGPPGKDATISPEQIQQIAIAIQASLESIQVVAGGRNAKGETVLFPIADVRLGETLILPPATVHGLDHTGKLIDTEILPIGGTINIKAPGLVKVPSNGG